MNNKKQKQVENIVARADQTETTTNEIEPRRPQTVNESGKHGFYSDYKNRGNADIGKSKVIANADKKATKSEKQKAKTKRSNQIKKYEKSQMEM